jgi:hypothetical protein
MASFIHLCASSKTPDKRQGQVGDLFDYRDLGAITGS